MKTIKMVELYSTVINTAIDLSIALTASAFANAGYTFANYIMNY